MRFLIVLTVCVAAAAAEKRVVGGQQAKRGGNPYLATVLNSSDGSYRCSGVLIDRRWIATAAHCVSEATAGSLNVMLGEYSLSSRDGTEQKFRAIVRAMTNYQETSGYPNNIALLKLDRDAQLNRAVRPLALPDGRSFNGDSCQIVGWGKTSSDGGVSDVPNTARVTAITNDACTNAWADVRGASIFSTQICAQNNGIQTCNGDSGSPLVCGGKFAGIASWGDGSCAGTHPFVFTRVSSYVRWINGIIAKH